MKAEEFDHMKPITDKAEISVDFPDKAYIGSFSQHSSFEVRADGDGIAIKLIHPSEDRRTAEIHLHYYLLADILAEAAQAIAGRPALDDSHREPLLEAATNLERALSVSPARTRAK
jgi:hypothetical protein